MQEEPELLGSMDECLEEPDLDALRRQRYLRNQEVMKIFSPSIASSVAHESIRPKLSREDAAAVAIQRLVRGFLARRRYVALLFERFEQEEEKRMAKTLQQCREGELLIRNRQLWIDMDDDVTLRRNKQIQKECAATTLQRAWRRYLARSKPSPLPMSTSSTSSPSSTSSSPSLTTRSPGKLSPPPMEPAEDEEEEEEEVTPTAVPAHIAALAAPANDADEAASLVSDYSELTGPVRAHFKATGGHLVRREDLRIGNTLPSPGSRADSESDTEANLARKLRKHNLLSLAVEFAQLKQQDRSALPFGLHKLAGEEAAATEQPDLEMEEEEEEEEEEEDGTAVPMEEGSSDEPPLDDDDDYDDDPEDGEAEEECELRPVTFSVLGEPERSTSEERSFPQVDWDTLEANLRLSEEEENQRQAYRLERARVLESLSMAGNDSFEGTTSPGVPRRLFAAREPMFRNEAALSDQEDSEIDSTSGGTWRRNMPPSTAAVPRITELTKPMQLCFINDISSDEDFGSDPPTRASPRRHFLNEALQCPGDRPKLPGEASPAPSCKGDFLLRRQCQLQAEAKIALAQAQPMAKMQLELEKQDRGGPILREIIGLAGIRGRSLNEQVLRSLSVAQLQLLINDFHSQIEALNRNLMDLLLDRDDLHMEQDSKLLDVEDLTRRAQEIATKLHDEKRQASPGMAAKNRLGKSAASRAGAKARSTTRAVTSRLAAFFKSSTSAPAAATT